LHKQFGQKQGGAANTTLIVLHEWNLFGVLELHFHDQQVAERACRCEIQVVEQQAQASASVAKVLLVN